nr:TIR domain-containing protein [Oscillospiraceae bacterium]
MKIYEGQEKYIFISYAHKDSPTVLPIIEELDEAGFRVWYDGGIAAGTEWPEYVADHLVRAEVVLIFVSDHALMSQNCIREINYAVSKKKKMLAIHLEENIAMTPGIEMQLGSLQNMFYRRFIDRSSFVAKLIDAEIVKSCNPDYINNEEDGIEEEVSDGLSAFFGAEKVKKQMHREAVGDYADTIPIKIYKGSVSDEDQARIRNNARILNRILHDLKLRALVYEVSVGPRVTTYSINPDSSLRPVLLEKFKADIALSLSLSPQNIRLITPMIGAQKIAVEIVNSSQTVVRLDELMEEAGLRERMSIEERADTSICLGRTPEGDAMFVDLARLPHLLIGGIPATGKTTLLHSIIVSVITRVPAEKIKFILVDLKSIEFSVYDDMPHLLVPVIKNADDAAKALRWLCDEMERRYVEFAKLKVRNVDDYNAKAAETDIMPKLVLIIDDYTDLLYNHKSEIERSTTRLSAKSRAAGIHLILSTQRPENSTTNGILKANIATRMAFKTNNDIESRTIIDTAGAPLLLSFGDALYSFVASPSPVRVHTPFVSYETLEGITAHLIKRNGKAVYDKSAYAAISMTAERVSKDKPLEGDELLAEAARLAVAQGSMTVALLQRKLSIGYNKAAELMDKMTEMGVLTEYEGSKARRVMISLDEWEKKFNKGTTK